MKEGLVREKKRKKWNGKIDKKGKKEGKGIDGERKKQLRNNRNRWKDGVCRKEWKKKKKKKRRKRNIKMDKKREKSRKRS